MKKITRRSMLKGSAVAAAALALSACGGSSSSTASSASTAASAQPAQLPLTTSASPRRRPSRWQFPARQAADPIWRSVTIVRA